MSKDRTFDSITFWFLVNTLLFGVAIVWLEFRFFLLTLVEFFRKFLISHYVTWKWLVHFIFIFLSKFVFMLKVMQDNFITIASLIFLSKYLIPDFFVYFQELTKFWNDSILHSNLLLMHPALIIILILPNELQFIYLFICEMRSIFYFILIFHNSQNALCFKGT